LLLLIYQMFKHIKSFDIENLFHHVADKISLMTYDDPFSFAVTYMYLLLVFLVFNHQNLHLFGKTLYNVRNCN